MKWIYELANLINAEPAMVWFFSALSIPGFSQVPRPVGKAVKFQPCLSEAKPDLKRREQFGLTVSSMLGSSDQSSLLAPSDLVTLCDDDGDNSRMVYWFTIRL